MSDKSFLVNPFELEGNWYKANLHAHTTLSDGLLTVDQRLMQYHQAGYDVLAITDHWKTNDVSASGNGSMLVISGMEYHPPCPGHAVPYHLVALNVPHGFAMDDSTDAQRCIEQVRSAGGASVLAHPSWCGHGLEQFRPLRGVIAMEVFNSTGQTIHRASSESEWAMALDSGWALPAIASDDCHSQEGYDVMEAWTWLKMPSLSPVNVLEAIARGACYGSRGPLIHDLRLARGKVTVRCSAAAAIHFSGGPGQGALARPAGSHGLTHYSIAVPKWPYVRAVVTDRHGHEAWTNPIFLE